MSTAAYATAVRNYLRTNLTSFYEDQDAQKAANCKVMLDEKPAANCGQEFIAIYGSFHQPPQKKLMNAIDEEFGLTIAVSRKIAVIPPDYRGELGYINVHTIPERTPPEDLEVWTPAWISVEERCREIVKLLMADDKYLIMKDANTLLPGGSPFTEPMEWLHTDSYPRQVGPEHFTSFDELEQDADPIFGLVMKVYLGGARRLQPTSDLDRIPE